jgi:hypothetical protein
MKTNKNKLPKAGVVKLYNYSSKAIRNGMETSTASDPTTTCTTVITTTH